MNLKVPTHQPHLQSCRLQWGGRAVTSLSLSTWHSEHAWRTFRCALMEVKRLAGRCICPGVRSTGIHPLITSARYSTGVCFARATPLPRGAALSPGSDRASWASGMDAVRRVGEGRVFAHGAHPCCSPLPLGLQLSCSWRSPVHPGAVPLTLCCQWVKDLGLRTQSWFVNVHPSCRLVMVIFLVWRSDVTYVLPYLRELTGTLKLFVV